MSKGGIKIPPESDNTFASSLIDNCPLTHTKFAGNYLRLSSISPHQNVINLYIPYTLDICSRYISH